MSFWQDIADFFNDVEGIKRAIYRIELAIERVETKQEAHIMATSAQADEVNIKLDELDQKTNDAADRLRQIIAAIQPGMTQAQVDAIKGRIQSESDRLATWGTSADDPLPVS